MQNCLATRSVWTPTCMAPRQTSTAGNAPNWPDWSGSRTSSGRRPLMGADRAMTTAALTGCTGPDCAAKPQSAVIGKEPGTRTDSSSPAWTWRDWTMACSVRTRTSSEAYSLWSWMECNLNRKVNKSWQRWFILTSFGQINFRLVLLERKWIGSGWFVQDWHGRWLEVSGHHQVAIGECQGYAVRWLAGYLVRLLPMTGTRLIDCITKRLIPAENDQRQ